jgi:prophage maintenance system killer protein
MNIIKYMKIDELLRQKADLKSRLKLIPYEGSIEIKTIKDKRYIYLRKRILNKYTSTYVDSYSDELFYSITDALNNAKALKKEIRKINIHLVRLGYKESELTPRVLLNIDFARINMKSNIYDQAILEGITTTYIDTETIIENGKVSSLSSNDIQKILNLKHAWEFIMDEDVVASKSNYFILCYIANFVNEGFYSRGGRIRGVPVKIGGTSYIPPLPVENIVIEEIENIISKDDEIINIAIELCLYCMKKQIFNDGNKRTAVIFANHYLISKGGGLLIIPENKVTEFKRLLIDYYEDKDEKTIKEFMKKHCWKQF